MSKSEEVQRQAAERRYPPLPLVGLCSIDLTDPSLTIDDVRQAVGLPPVPWGKAPAVPQPPDVMLDTRQTGRAGK